LAQFINRKDAGQQLARHLGRYIDQTDVLVLGLPRGGIPVGAEIAKLLHAPLDVFLVRKLGVPGQEELAMGAIASGGVRVLNEEVIRQIGITSETIEQVTQIERAELKRREEAYRGDRPTLDARGKTVILVDDGLATGASMYAALLAIREQHPARIVVAVPVAAPETFHAFQALVDEMICALTPTPFYGVGAWYEDFSQVSDEQVRALLDRYDFREY
jgi:putative phosphoribosyl transferase